ncbi:MAG: serine/threonine protein kinase [Leptolyngbyaceae cyanobacterium T60_A2020_046]|nr:serine/threonine protein kinase [Leptolyngbyaceae cyanobacterium T60_A2020_046]
MSDPNIGKKLTNRYELIELIGQGAMGRVYKAEDTLLGGVTVAVKFLSQTLLNDKMRDRFVQEATTCAQLGQKSIHVVRVTDYGVSEDEVPFYVMEYLQGDSLSALINQSPLPVPRFLGLTRQICLGLKSAHDGIRVKGYPKPVAIIHRDIKPSNILVTQDNSLGELAKILDFGIAKLIQADSDQTSSFMGTLAYASPEQMEGRELDSRSDIYSLGVMMFQMLSGKLPLRAQSHTFGGWYKVHHEQIPQPLSEVSAELKIPKLLETIVMSCLEKQPENRPQSVGEILKSLEPLEQRFGTGFRIGQRIGATLSRLPVVKKPTTEATRKEPPTAPSSNTDVCRLTSWPRNKPIAEIVFPYALQTSTQNWPTLWVMMPKVEIEKRLLSTRYNNFICTMSPHPMALWLTVLYSGEHGPRWLPCYLDLKTQSGQEMGFLLGQAGQYKILFFALENPQQCAHVVTCNIAAPQRKLLQEWVMTARNQISVGSPSISKEMLKAELNNNLKDKVIQQLETLYVR